MMRRTTTFLAVLSATVFTVAAESIRADIILGNLAGSNDANAYPLYDTSQKAVSFTMGAQSYQLDAAVLRLNYGTGSPIVELRNDVGGANPGNSVLATFTTPPIAGGGIQSYVFTPTSSVTLNAGTKYWLNVYGGGDDFGQAAFWYRSNPDVTPAGGAADWSDYRQTNDGGGSWNGSTTFNTFELQGTIPAVPEPSSLLLVAATCTFAGARRIRRRR